MKDNTNRRKSDQKRAPAFSDRRSARGRDSDGARRPSSRPPRKEGFSRSDREDDDFRTAPMQEGAGEESTQLIFGRNAVLELLRADRAIDKLYVRKDGERSGSISLIVAEALARSIPVVEVEAFKLNRMAGGGNHQGVIASAAAKEYCSVQDILDIARERGEKPLIVMADGIEDPQNLGTLIRVCECAGVHGLILPKRHAVGLTEVCAKASAGAIAHLAIAKVTNPSQTVDELKKEGIWVFAAEAGGQPYETCDMNCPALIIMGSEGFGVSRLLKEKSDYLVSIPMYGLVNSLNVSTAAAIIIHEAARQCRRQGR